MEQEIVIKPYESIDDEGLKNLCIKNMFHTQKLTRKTLVDWTIKSLGSFQVILRLSLAHTALALILKLLGLDLKSATIVSFVSILLALTIAYGVVLPKKFVNLGNDHVVSTITKDFADIRRNFMGENKCFWIAIQKVSTPTSSERIVGCVLVEPYNWNKDEYKLADKRKELGEVAELRRMSVAQDVRGKGIGMRLGLELKKFCVEKGYHTIVLSTLENNYPAIALYQKLGFKLRNTGYEFSGVIPFRWVEMVLKL